MDSRTSPLTWLAMAIGLIGGLVLAGPATAQGSAQFVYQVNHSVFGDIGTYTNTVEPNRDGTTVKTRAHFEVKMLGVRMYHEDADRTERWQGNRLVSFPAGARTSPQPRDTARRQTPYSTRARA